MPSLTPDETILGLLSIQPQHGYDLVTCFHQPQVLGRVWRLSTSQIYAVLKRLSRNGWIKGKTITTAQTPPRTEYTITPVGEAILKTWLFEPRPAASVRRIRVEFLSRLYIAEQLNYPTDAIIAAQRASCAQRCAELQAELITSTYQTEKRVVALQVSQLSAAVAWLDTLKNISPKSDLIQRE